MILHVRAVGAKDIPKMDYGGGMCDPFLIFNLKSNPKSKHKTKIIKKTYEPKWNEEFHFPIKSISDDTLHVELYDWDLLSSNDLISTKDFEISSFQLGKVVHWNNYFVASPKVEKPGKVNLIFHLAKKDDEPFKEKSFETNYSTMNIVIDQLSKEEINEARDEFYENDQDGNGVLDEREFDKYINIFKAELSCFSKLIVQVFGQNGGVSIDQFLLFYRSFASNRDSDEFIGRYIFDYFDKDHKGKIDASDFQKVADLINFPEGTQQETIDTIDKMNYNEFSQRFYTLLKMAWKGLVVRCME